MEGTGYMTYATYLGMMIGSYELNLVADLAYAKRVIENDLDAFCEECDVTDFSWDFVILETRDDARGLYISYDMETLVYRVENATYGVVFDGATLDEAYAAYGSWKETLIGMYRGFVITRTETGYMADCEGLMSRFTCADILDVRRAVDSEHASQSRAWASDYGYEHREDFTDSENFIRDVMEGKY